MKDIFRKHWFFFGLAFVGMVAYFFPELGDRVRQWRIAYGAIFLAFVVVGLTLDSRKIFHQILHGKPLLAAAVFSLLIMPAATWFLARPVFGADSDFVVGAVIIAAAPVTVASGTVMTAMALGNVALSLLICVLCNALALVTLPLILPLLLGAEGAVSLPAGAMFRDLAVTVLLPTALGQGLRPMLARHAESRRKQLSVFSQCVVLLIVFNAVSSSVERLSALSGPGLAGLVLFMALLRLTFLAASYGVARALRLDDASVSAFAIHASQKTLTVSYVVWAGFFAERYPLALLPGIFYHLTQMISDTVLAKAFRRRAERAGAGPYLLNCLMLAVALGAVGCAGCAGTAPKRPPDQERTLSVTAYCNCGECCGWKRNWWGRPIETATGRPKRIGLTASGAMARHGTVAAPRDLPFGTIVYVEGYGYGRVEDRGGAIKGNRLDLWFRSHQASLEWGRRDLRVKIWLPDQDGKKSSPSQPARRRRR